MEERRLKTVDFQTKVTFLPNFICESRTPSLLSPGGFYRCKIRHLGHLYNPMYLSPLIPRISRLKFYLIRPNKFTRITLVLSGIFPLRPSGLSFSFTHLL